MLTIRVEDQYAQKTLEPTIASGSVGTVKVHFNLDDSWKEFSVLKASFYCDGDRENVYYSTLDDNRECVIPAEAIASPGKVFVGVYGLKGSSVKTSTNVMFEVKDGAIPKSA